MASANDTMYPGDLPVSFKSDEKEERTRGTFGRDGILRIVVDSQVSFS